MDKKTFISLYEGSSVKAEGIWEAQIIAKKCMEELSSYLRSGLNRDEIHDHCAKYMTELGSEGWWIHNDPALVLFGKLTVYSSRTPADEYFKGKVIEENDIVSVDVAPTVRGGWGDITRTFFIKDGKTVPVEETGNEEWIEGMKLEHYMHERMKEFVNEKTTFSELHAFSEEILKKHGYHNCDYHDNYGHTIENDQSERVTICKEEGRCIAEYGKPFTYEPHICKDTGEYGMKHEIMYVFYEGRVQEI